MGWDGFRAYLWADVSDEWRVIKGINYTPGLLIGKYLESPQDNIDEIMDNDDDDDMIMTKLEVGNNNNNNNNKTKK